jgi:hypothetical protein
MIQDEVLFQGTWAEALEHPEKISADRQVRIVSVRKPKPALTPEESRALVDEIAARARAIPPDVDESVRRDDPYYQALVDKYRKQGFEFK